MAWTPRVSTSVIDNGLASLKSAATTIWICDTGMSASTNPTYTEVSSTYDLGSKVFGAGAVFPAAIAASGSDGRMVTTAAVTDGAVSTNGTAAYWGVTDASAVLAAGNLSATQAVTSGNTFTLGAFNITIKFQ